MGAVVQTDERSHARVYPPPPIAGRCAELPHDWLTAFEDINDWAIVVDGAEDVRVRRCTYRPLFHEHHVEIGWSTVRDGSITLTPPQPLQLPPEWDTVDFWIGGIPDDWRAVAMQCRLSIIAGDGTTHLIDVTRPTEPRRPHAVDMFHRLVLESLRADLQNGALAAITIDIAEAAAQHHLQLYCLTFYRHCLQRRYRRPKRLPFPTHPDGVVPAALTRGSVTVEADGGNAAATLFNFAGEDGSRLCYRYEPFAGGLADITVRVDDQAPFKPCVGGGLVLQKGRSRLIPPYRHAAATLVSQELAGACLRAVWEVRSGTVPIRYAFHLRMVQRSLVIEVGVEGQNGVEMRIGFPEYPGAMRAIEVPMLAWDWRARRTTQDYELGKGMRRKGGRARSPAVLLAGDCFLSAFFDWYCSEASTLYSIAETAADGAGFDGGAYYLPVIDRGRNPLREKLILTVSRDFHEVLPNIPNPASPHGRLMRDRVYNHGVSSVVSAARHRNLGIHAVATLVQSHHAASDRGGYRPSLDAGCMDEWVDDPSRARGGLERTVARARELREIGWLIGTYTNYCLMSPLFAHFAEIPCAHDADGYHRSTWPGSMVPATGETLQTMRRQSRKMRRKCGYQLIYDDQRTVLPIWRFNDYTPDAPGAGKFRATFEQTAQLYMGRREQINGPIMSEGGVHWMYSGLIDGNIARIQHVPRILELEDKDTYRCPPPPDLVDFQLLKIHLLSVDFCGNDYFEGWDPALRDKFVSETLAYGKIGMWSPFTGQGTETVANSCRTYYTFHLAQKRYRCVPVECIRYHDGRELVDTSTILRQGRERLGRVYVRYRNGFESWVNLNGTDPWPLQANGCDIVLPAYGWYQRRAEEWGEFVSYSCADEDGGRRVRIRDRDTLLVSAPGRIVCWDDLETDGTVLVRREPTGGWRVANLDASGIRIRADRLGLSGGTAAAVVHTYDLDGTPVRDGTVSQVRGWVDLGFLAREQFALVLA